MTQPAGEPPDPAGPLDLPDLAAPLPLLPVCSACGHLRVTHWRGRCRADVGPGNTCGCSGFAAPPGGRLDGGHDLDVSEDPHS